MDNIKEILEKLMNKEISIAEAENLLKGNLIENVSEIAKLDIFRKTRTGIPEVVYAEKKHIDILMQIIKRFLESTHFVIISRYNSNQKEQILEEYANNNTFDIEINPLGKIIIIKKRSFKFIKTGGKVGIITAGSSDIAIAEEAKVIAKAMGCETITSYDVGIAGFHRIFPPLGDMIRNDVHVIIVCAGMEGTLPGVVSALVDVPVIGVPVSCGYGMGEKGKGALITMLQSCSPGLLVVNIDNGFGAGASAALIANKIVKER